MSGSSSSSSSNNGKKKARLVCIVTTMAVMQISLTSVLLWKLGMLDKGVPKVVDTTSPYVFKHRDNDFLNKEVMGLQGRQAVLAILQERQEVIPAKDEKMPLEVPLHVTPTKAAKNKDVPSTGLAKTGKAIQRRAGNSCDALFGMDQLSRTEDGLCLKHARLKFAACHVGPITIHPSLIRGAVGGDDVMSVLGRSERDEALNYGAGSLIKNATIPPSIIEKFSGVAKNFVQSIRLSNTTKQVDTSSDSPPTVYLLIDRGDYANLCMNMMKMMNSFLVTREFGTTKSQVVFLDGYAKSGLDDFWEALFGKPIHLKQFPDSKIISPAIVLTPVSPLGDEGLTHYDWGSPCEAGSMLHLFRDFVLERLEIVRSTNNTSRVTLLVRENYRAHPRSDGVTDRSLFNKTDDAEYIQSLYPDHNVEVVSFENMPIPEQIRVISQTDVLVAVHGAGNMHAMFLPDHGALVEYFPKGFTARTRFKFVCSVLGLTYTKRNAVIRDRLPGKKLVVSLRP